MTDVKFVCFTGVSSTYMATKLNEKAGDEIKFSAVPFNKINDVKDSTDLFVLGSMYTQNIVDRVKRQAGDNKVISLKNYDYSSTAMDGILDQVKEAL